MTKMSFLSSELGLGAEESLDLLDDYLEVTEHFKPHGFPSDKANAVPSGWLAVDGSVSASNDGQEDKMDLKEFDFDALLNLDDLETMPDELLAMLDDMGDLFAPLTVNPVDHLPEGLTKADQVTPFTFLQPLPLFSGVLSSTSDHSFSLELGSEVDISEGDRKSDSTAYITLIPQCVKEEDTTSDTDSGVCMSPKSYLGSPQHSPSTASGSPNSLPSPGKMVAAKVKGEKLVKKLKKMEQNKTAATRYHQKKRAEQEALAGQCKELEKKNEALKEKEIQYLQDLIEEVRKARRKKRVP
uniref:Cyclic AMP-dependent transcription factor ATF-4 n=1 Tax=Microcebus murinus TaxID=30608 RepID=A0A8C5XYT4_MICMU